jgi:hypothetical protein
MEESIPPVANVHVVLMTHGGRAETALAPLPLC